MSSQKLGSVVNWKHVSANYEAALRGDLDAIAVH